LHLLSLALVLIYILTLPLLVSGTILGIVSDAATSETLVIIALTVLLLWLVVVPLSRKLGAVGCLLLLLLIWSDHPSPLMLLRSSALSVGHNPEALRLC
jgi:ABC-type Fe3+-siderophore transport system permease subunit